MRRFAVAMAAVFLLAAAASPVSACGPATRGFLPAGARPHGYSLVSLATAWNAWVVSAPADTNPLLQARCEQSPLDPKIWFVPEPNLGGPTTATCTVPHGAFLVFSPFFMECSSAEPDPFHGSNPAELRACVRANFDLLTSVKVRLDGRAARHLTRYVVTTRVATVPADNLLGPDPALTMSKGFFMVIRPPKRGTHTLSASWAVDAYGAAAATTFTIIVH